MRLSLICKWFFSNNQAMAVTASGVFRYGWILVLLGLVACQRTEVNKTPPAPPSATVESPASTATNAPTIPDDDRKKGQILISPNYDAELRQIFELTKRNEWEEAELRASALYALDPKDSSVQRVYKWVQTEAPKHRERVLEDRIRRVMSEDNTRFNPTISSILQDKKSRGLPPRSDLREAIELLKNAPYIPDNYGKTIKSTGTLEDYRNKTNRLASLLEKKVSVHLDNVPLEDVIFKVGQSEGINFVADRGIPAFQQKLTVNMKQGRLRELLDFVARNMNVQFQVGENLIWIIDANDTNKVMQETRFYHLRKGFVLPAKFGDPEPTQTIATTPVGATVTTTVTEVQKVENFVRDGAPSEPFIETAIKQFFLGKYVVDYTQNLVVARGTPEQLKLLEQIIDAFDRPMQQVLIEARFITVTEATFLKLGVAWETDRDILSTGGTPTDYTGLGDNVGSGLEMSFTNVLGRKNLTATLSAIDQNAESETLSSPRISVVNNLPATISDGKVQFYYDEYKISQTVLETRTSSKLVPSGSPSSVIAGIKLNVLASIGGDGDSITLALNPTVSSDVRLVTFATVSDRDDLGRLSSSFDIKLPELREQSLSTRVTIKSGQTVVMGGVLQREQKTFMESVPILGKIPLLGAAFRRRTESDRPRYLLVFVTATLLSENGEFIVSSEAK